MLTLEQIRAGLKDRNLKVVAEDLDLNYITITQVANGSQQNPKYKTLKALSDYLKGIKKQRRHGIETEDVCDYSLLKCPKCKNTIGTHHNKTTVYNISHEDGGGIKTVINDDGKVESNIFESKECNGRRDQIKIQFWCETCGSFEDDLSLIIRQHKGQTMMFWGYGE